MKLHNRTDSYWGASIRGQEEGGGGWLKVHGRSLDKGQIVVFKMSCLFPWGEKGGRGQIWVKFVQCSC